MSTATCVRETWNLSGDDARRTLAATGRVKLLRDAVARLRAADGFSHARSLAFATSLVLVQGLIVLVGLAMAFGQQSFVATVFGAIGSSVPGPAGGLLFKTLAQAQKVALEHRSLPLFVGLGGMLVTATTATGQLIRGINRIYGVEKDGAFLHKYGRAFAVAVSLLGALVAGFAILTLGRHVSPDGDRMAHVAWRVLRWPTVLGLAAAAFGGILRWAPERRQPQWSWLMFGGLTGVAGWTMVTVALSVAFKLSSSFGDVYGPLAGVVALQLWTFSSAVAVLLGAAVAAQLEVVRSGTQPSARV